MKTFYSHTFGQKRKGRKCRKQPTPNELKDFVLAKHAALTAWMLAENMCGFQWEVMEWLAAKNPKAIEVWSLHKELSLYNSPVTKKADFRPGDTEASRMVISVQKLCRTKAPRLLLVPISLFLGAIYKGKDEGRYYAEDNWKTIHQVGLVVDPLTKTFYLFEPSSTMAVFSNRVKVRFSALFKLIGFNEGKTCGFLSSLALDDEDMCVSWMMYFFASVVLNPTTPPLKLRAEITYKGLLLFLYYVFTTFRWPFDNKPCGVYLLGDEYPELALAAGETLEDASYGLEPHEFKAVDVLGVHL